MAHRRRANGGESGLSRPSRPRARAAPDALAALRESEERYRILIEHTQEGIFIFDLEKLRILDANPAYLRLLGYEGDELIGTDLRALVEGGADALEAVLAKLRRGEAFVSERRHRRKDGTLVDVEVNATVLPSQGQRIGCAVVHDVSARKRQQQLELDRAVALELVAKNQPLETTLRHLVAMVERQRPGLSCEIVLGPDVPVADQGQWVARVLSGQGEPRGALVATCRPARLPGPDDLVLLETAVKLAGIAIDHKELTDRLAWQAQHDHLTGLPNRRLFEDRLRQAIAVARRHGEMLGLLYIDLDRFKQVNDTLGHAFGDRLLQEVAKLLGRIVRPSDTVARMGGDEFTVIVTDLQGPQEAVRRAGEILEALRHPIALEEHELFVTGSVGIAMFPQDGDDSATLQRSADIAMYRAKSEGRNGFHCFTAEMNEAAAERHRLETMLRRALENRELEVHFQPEVSLSTGLVGFETLLRWTHAKHGAVSPSKFIPVAEESGLVVPIGAWVLREACRSLAAWGPAASKLRVAVNVSSVQFVQADFVEMVAEAVRGAGIRPDQLELELTESMLMRDYEASSHKLQELRRLGVSIAVDDFGTGYSSLSHLHRLPIDALKIDQSFVRELGGPLGGARPLVEAIVALGRGLGLDVIAEGVETQAQLDFLAKVGCDRVQGFLLGAPVTGEEARRMIEGARPVGGGLVARG